MLFLEQVSLISSIRYFDGFRLLVSINVFSSLYLVNQRSSCLIRLTSSVLSKCYYRDLRFLLSCLVPNPSILKRWQARHNHCLYLSESHQNDILCSKVHAHRLQQLQVHHHPLPIQPRIQRLLDKYPLITHHPRNLITALINVLRGKSNLISWIKLDHKLLTLIN